LFVGETNSSNQLEGYGIKYEFFTQIGAFKNNADAPGRYVKITPKKDIFVGEIVSDTPGKLKY
jgi:hypothetical protein